jgi:hypothetical protein
MSFFATCLGHPQEIVDENSIIRGKYHEGISLSIKIEKRWVF